MSILLLRPTTRYAPKPSHNPGSDVQIGKGSAVHVVILVVMIFWPLYTLCITALTTPRNPDFAVSSFDVPFFNLSTTSSSSPLLTASWNLSFSVTNTYIKRAGVFFNRLNVSLFYGPRLISQASIAPFYNPRHETTAVHATVMVDSEPIRLDDAHGIIRDLDRGGVIDFHVRFLAWIKHDCGNPFKDVLGVLCGNNMTVGLHPLSQDSDAWSGSWSGPTRECLVYEAGPKNLYAF